ncbi:TPA: hypothetical protein EYP44_01455 [Candidatus Bathyarchaeota archaeon]|nr:hypothetical protein [Candidatus Bathyarchaeota archaeon]
MGFLKSNRLWGFVILLIGLGLLLFTFYLAYDLLKEIPGALERAEPQVLQMPGGGGLKVPGISAMNKLIEVIMAELVLFIMGYVASAIAGKGVGLLKK